MTETEVKKVKEKVSLNTAGGSDVEKKNRMMKRKR